MYTAPPIPPRRVPPPPARALTAPPGGVALPYFNQGSKNSPPVVPPRSAMLSDQSTSGIERDKLLARRPPPPPMRRLSAVARQPNPSAQQSPPVIPLRKLPVLQSFHPIPPPKKSASKLATVRKADIPVQSAPSLNELSISCLQCRDFSKADAHAALFPRREVHTLESLARNLTEPFNNDFDKARVLFTWLHHNIIYDVGAPLTGNVQPATAEGTFSTGVSVSDGYAVLFEHLADLVGLQCHKVSGHGKDYGYEPLSENVPVPEMTTNHAWNCIMLQGNWHLVDACWGAGVRAGTTWQAKFNPTWFIASPIEFATKHFPEDPSFQLTPEEITWEEYITAKPGPTLLGDFAELGLHPLHIEPATKYIVEKRFTRFSVSKRCEHMSMDDNDNYIFVLTTGDAKDMTPLSYNDEEQAWTATFFTPRNGSVMLYAVDTINSKDAKGLGVAGFLKAKGKKAMTTKSIATWSIIHL